MGKDATNPPVSGAFTKRTWAALGRFAMSRRFAFILAAAALAAGGTTFAMLTGTSSGTGTADSEQVALLLIIDLVVLLMLVAVIAQRIVAMWAMQRSGMAGAALHVRMVVMFSLLAVTPAILVTVFAALFLHFGINFWFNERVRTAVDASQVVANAYLEEHIQNIGTAALGMANTLNRDASKLVASPPSFAQTLTDLAHESALAEAVVVDANSLILVRARYSVLQLRRGEVPADAIKRADNGEVAILTAPNADQVRAIVRLDRFVGAYLLVERYIDVRVLSNMARVREASKSYLRLEQNRDAIQVTFVAIFAVVALLLLLAAVWIGMTLANQLVRPISKLIDAAQGVSRGDLSARVSVDDTIGELGSLSKAFNDMTEKLGAQQDGLMQMNRELDERRRFTETVLGGVSAGVIGLGNDACIDLSNRSASLLLGVNLSEASGRFLAELVPEMAEVVAEAMDRPDRLARAEITVLRDLVPSQLIVTAAAEQLEGEVIGYVVTFDDITELQSAQRKAAWADVARRIAHEIKNPLTPIQLSAERLKRKYLKQITDDPETFVMCTETIIRQVEELGRMVDEFSSFSRMPQAVLKAENISNLCRQALFLERSRCEGDDGPGAVEIAGDLPDDDITIHCDAQQISRALTNVLKNAAESVAERLENDASKGGDSQPGTVHLKLTRHDTPKGTRTIITVKDSGTGLPETDLARLTEPYITTRDRGTGLGLAIVKKIMEDHGGNLLLENNTGGGALVSLSFPPAEAPNATT